MFKKGDRVRVINTDGAGYLSVKEGQIGTVLESNDPAPWVEFDEPTGWYMPSNHQEYARIGSKAKPGHLDAVGDHRLALVTKERKPLITEEILERMTEVRDVLREISDKLTRHRAG